MPFFKDLRRKRGSSKTEKSPSGSKAFKGSNGTVPTAKSSSTVNSLYDSSTPASTIQPQTSVPNLWHRKSANGISPLPQRPIAVSPSPNRNSVLVSPWSQLEGRGQSDGSALQGLSTPSISGGSTPRMPTSAFAPRILSISDNSWVRPRLVPSRSC